MYRDFKKVKIGLISPREIQEWGERSLLDGTFIGEVLNPETVHYKTLKPEMGGLFCQKIFGPIKNYICACDKKIKNEKDNNPIFCPICDVEYTNSRVRRYRFGHIKLKYPIIHSLYASHQPSPLPIFLNWSNIKLNNIISASEFCFLSSSFFNFSSWFQIFKYIKEYLNIPQNKKIPKLFHKSFKTKKLKFKHTNAFIFSEIKNYYDYIAEPEEFLLYGINYDMTWNELNNFYSFLYYIWSSPKESESFIPYYYYIRKIKNNNLPYTIRNDSDSFTDVSILYPIQTSGAAIEKILAHYDSTNLIKQLEFDFQHINDVLNNLKQKINNSNESFDSNTLDKVINKKQELDFKIDEFKIDEFFIEIEAENNQKLDQSKQELEFNDELNDIISFKENWEFLKQLRNHLLRKINYFKKIYLNGMQPAWMILTCLPVLPPNLRPITKIDDQVFISDINQLYQRVIARNNRFIDSKYFGILDKDLLNNWKILSFNIKLLQGSIDSLFQTGKVDSFDNSLNQTEKPKKSLLDSLKGKKGRFRQHLLGKRVDYSGRSVIVVGPALKLHECGLPFEMAVELFQPYIIQKLIRTQTNITTIEAKVFIAENKYKIWDLLKEIMRGHPIILNRAPTLHRLGIQAFFPKLIYGKMIQLHPLVCSAFNADFDGDQMAVHLPLTFSAQAEALYLIWSRNHIYSSASGQPIILPAQDMILGCFFLTSSTSLLFSSEVFNNIKKYNQLIEKYNYSYNKITKENKIFTSIQEIQNMVENGELTTHTPIWVHWPLNYQNMETINKAEIKERPIEYQIDFYGNINLIRRDRYKFITNKSYNYIRTTPGRLFFYDLI
uniref:RNA polymerase subunit beta' n=1 Tax=Prototheca fontanea TaxID=2836215 RepID=UPI0030029C5B